MTPRLAGKRALITGAGGALGRASALLFAREGASVAVVDAVRATAAETVEAIRSAGGTAIDLVADVRDEDQVAAAVAYAVAAFGGLDTAFVNAGIMPHQDGSVASMDLQLWRNVLDINVIGASLCARHALPHLVSAGGGTLILMSSFLAVMGCSYPQDAYTASKGAVAALTRSLAVQYGPAQVRVNALAPGPIETPHVAAFFADPAARQLRLGRVPLGRFGRPEDVAELAGFLASDGAGWLTGQIIVLDGGISSHYL